jgi:hypothetical protein
VVYLESFRGFSSYLDGPQDTDLEETEDDDGAGDGGVMWAPASLRGENRGGNGNL